MYAIHCAKTASYARVYDMIQSLSDVLLLVSVIAIGVVGFLLAILLYHLIFVVLDARQVMKRANDISREVEEIVLRPVEVVGSIVDWVQKWVIDTYLADDKPKKVAKSRKKTKKSKKKTKKKS